MYTFTRIGAALSNLEMLVEKLDRGGSDVTTLPPSPIACPFPVPLGEERREGALRVLDDLKKVTRFYAAIKRERQFLTSSK